MGMATDCYDQLVMLYNATATATASATATSNATASALLLRVVPLYSKPDFILFSLLFLPLHLQTAELFSQQKKDHVAAQKGRLSLVITSAEGEHIPSWEQHQILNRRPQKLSTRNGHLGGSQPTFVLMRPEEARGRPRKPAEACGSRANVQANHESAQAVPRYLLQLKKMLARHPPLQTHAALVAATPHGCCRTGPPRPWPPSFRCRAPPRSALSSLSFARGS